MLGLPNPSESAIKLERIRNREDRVPRLSFVCFSLLTAVVTCVHADQRELRTWTSEDGKFQIQAILVETKPESVVLQRADGVSIEVPISRLSPADVGFLFQIPPPLPTSEAVPSVERAACDLERSKLAASVFKAYFAAWPAASSAQFAYESSLSKLSAAATANRIRRRNEWFDLTQIETSDKEIENLLQQAITRIQEKRGDDARTLLQKAAVANPSSSTANSFSGLIWAAAARDYAQAKTQLSEARSRDPYSSSLLNNFAISELRIGNLALAMNLWQQAIDYAPWSSEIRRNIRNLSKRHATGGLVVPATSVVALRSLEENASRSDETIATDDSWVYLPPTEHPESTAFGTGFVVGNGFVMTQIAEYQPDRPVVVYFSENMIFGRPASVVAYDAATGMAILSTDTRDAAALPLKRDFPRVGSMLRAAGYLRPTHITDSYRFAPATVAAVPSTASDGVFVCKTDQLLGPGLSPVFNPSGEVVGAFVKVQRLGDSIGFGLPVTALEKFLAEHVRSNAAPAVPASPKAWDQIQAEIRKSIVLVKQPRSYRVDLCGGASLALQDKFCDRCRGFGLVDCPVSACANGGILVEVAEVTGRIPATGQEIITYHKVRHQCNKCGGRGKVSCPVCNGSGQYSGGSATKNILLQ